VREHGRLVQAALTRGPSEIGEAKSKHHRAAGPAGRAQPARDPIDERGEHDCQLLRRPLTATERPLRADAAAAAARLHRARILVAGQRVQVAPRALAKHPHQGGLVQAGHLPHGGEAALVKLLGRHGANAPEALDG